MTILRAKIKRRFWSIIFQAAVLLLKKQINGGCGKVALSLGYGGVRGGFAVSIFFIDTVLDTYWLKKAHIHRRDYTTADVKSVDI